MNENYLYRPCEQADGSVLSIDKLVLDIVARKDWCDVEGALRSFFGSECVTSRGAGKGASIGGYQMSWVVRIGKNRSFFLGLGPRFTGRVESSKGRLEFCPNKLMNDANFTSFLRWLEATAKTITPVRFDLAQDFPFSSNRILLVKNRRTLRTATRNSTTYQLGRHNSLGFYRQYDKGRESKLSVALTRCEMTCNAYWNYKDISKHTPRVVRLHEPEAILRGNPRVKSETIVLARVLARAALRAENVATELSQLDYRTRAKVVKLMSFGDLDLFPASGVASILQQVTEWRR